MERLEDASATRLDMMIAKEHHHIASTGQLRPEYYALLDERRRRIVNLPPKRG